MAKKKTTKKSNFNRLSAVPMIHWTTRATKGSTSDLPVHTRSMKLTAETFDECARLSLAKDLLTGEAPPPLQKDFDKLVETNKAKFMESNPDYEYRVGGRVPASV